MHTVENRTRAVELSPEELRTWNPSDYQLIDIREEEEFDHGKIPGAVRMDQSTLLERCRELLAAAAEEAEEAAGEDVEEFAAEGAGEDVEEFAAEAARKAARKAAAEAVEETMGARPVLPGISGEKRIVLYCKYGTLSRELADLFTELGYEAYNLSGGYGKWLLKEIEAGLQDEERRRSIEKSLQKKFKKDIYSRFVKAICDYELVKEGDRIAVCISGGKDSMIMAKLFQQLKHHNKFPFELVFLCMDPGYNEQNRHIIEQNARLLNIPLTFFQTDIFDAVFGIEKSPCYICARMRRGHLYKKAQELGCNKIALGHHFDDVIETMLMGQLYSGQFQAMMPKLHSTNFPGMELIRPLYLVREADIKHWRDYNGLNFIQCACKFTDTCTTCHTDGTTSSKRLETKKLIAELKKTNPYIEGNLFKAMENVSMATILGLKKDGVKHSFLEWYDSEKGESDAGEL